MPKKLRAGYQEQRGQKFQGWKLGKWLKILDIIFIYKNHGKISIGYGICEDFP